MIEGGENVLFETNVCLRGVGWVGGLQVVVAGRKKEGERERERNASKKVAE